MSTPTAREDENILCEKWDTFQIGVECASEMRLAHEWNARIDMFSYRVSFKFGNVMRAVRSTHEYVLLSNIWEISKPLEKLFAQKLKMLATHVEKAFSY